MLLSSLKEFNAQIPFSARAIKHRIKGEHDNQNPFNMREKYLLASKKLVILSH